MPPLASCCLPPLTAAMVGGWKDDAPWLGCICGAMLVSGEETLQEESGAESGVDIIAAYRQSLFIS